ncbi:MAG: hypothetical protein BWK80_09670 [Desulfobacteraceae bacterium IS3]|nr:MAG: hypothetical protein BWK80_09670 [Desulfobacteraceae bacterium IS3]
MRKYMEISAAGDIIISEDILKKAGLNGYLQILIGDGEIQIVAKKQDDAEKILEELAGCMGNEPAEYYDFNLKTEGFYGIG